MEAESKWWVHYWPHALVIKRHDRYIACLGAFLGMFLAEWVSKYFLHTINPWFVAPMGASAVLLFAVPASPLAQPWSIMGGNLISALVGVSCARWVPDAGMAISFAVAISIALMMQFRCLHPPSGAIALTAVLGGPSIHNMGYQFVIQPVLFNSIILTLIAIGFNNLFKRSYPHRIYHSVSHATEDRPAIERTGVSRADLHAVLEEKGELFDINEEDLQEILHLAEVRAHRRHIGNLLCMDFMARDVVSIQFDEYCMAAYEKINRNHISALPVLDADQKLAGIITLHDLLTAKITENEVRTKVWQIMSHPVQVVKPNDSISDLIFPLSNTGIHQMPVVNEVGNVVGMVTQSDLIAALFYSQIDKPT